jgi:hypothetical protein
MSTEEIKTLGLLFSSSLITRALIKYSSVLVCFNGFGFVFSACSRYLNNKLAGHMAVGKFLLERIPSEFIVLIRSDFH